MGGWGEGKSGRARMAAGEGGSGAGAPWGQERMTRTASRGGRQGGGVSWGGWGGHQGGGGLWGGRGGGWVGARITAGCSPRK